MRSTPRHVVFYGSLQQGLHLGGEPPFRSMVRLVGPCRLAGWLYEVGDGDYPGLVLDASGADGGDGGRIVHGELHEVLDDAVLALLDAWEGFDPAHPETSEYVRRAVRLVDPPIDAWVYEGRHAQRGPAVDGGDWRRHRAGIAGDR